MATLSHTLPPGRNQTVEFAEDVLLLFALVFAVPGVILVLAAPFYVLLRLAAMVGLLDSPL